MTNMSTDTDISTEAAPTIPNRGERRQVFHQIVSGSVKLMAAIDAAVRSGDADEAQRLYQALAELRSGLEAATPR